MVCPAEVTPKRKRKIPPKDCLNCVEVTPENALKHIIGVETDKWKLDKTLIGEYEKTKVTHFFLEYVGKSEVCPQCGQTMTLHDYKERVWRHANLDETVCYIHARIPRYKCDKCKTVRQVDIPWADPNVSYSNRFSEVAIEHMSQMSLCATAEMMLCSWNVLDNIVDRLVDNHLSNMDLSKVRKIRIDETSAKKRHRYITIITDVDTDRIIFISKGKDSQIVGEFADWLIEHNGNPNNIEIVCTDFGEPFINGAKQHLVNAKNVYDLFHLIQLGNQKLDKDRAANQENGCRLKAIRYALLKNESNLTDEERRIVFDVSNDNEIIGRSYKMNMSLRETLDYESPNMAIHHLIGWIKWVEEEGTKNFKALAKTVKKHLLGIILALRTGINNGFQEGLNARVQFSKRLANGYHREDRLGRIVYFREAAKDFVRRKRYGINNNLTQNPHSLQ